MDFLTQLNQALELAQTETVDLLPLCREHIYEFTELMVQVQAIDWESYMGLTHTAFSLAPSSSTNLHRDLVPPDSEPDYVIYQMHFERHTPSLGLLQRLLAIILISDCTNCCNALEAIKINSSGLIAYGNVSMTYHF